MSSSEIRVEKTMPSEAVDEPNQLVAVFQALGDATCRDIYQTLREGETPMTGKELAATADVALPSTYRKLERLTRAGLVDEWDEIDPDGHRRSTSPRGGCGGQRRINPRNIVGECFWK